MPSESELKKVTPADFIKQAESAAETLTGYITYDSAKPNLVLFGVSPFLCPEHPISTDLIESIMLGQSHPCVGQQRQMWNAQIVLKATAESKKEGSLLKLLVSLLAAAMHERMPSSAPSPCSCGGKSPGEPGVRSDTCAPDYHCIGGVSQCPYGCACYDPFTGYAYCSLCCVGRKPFRLRV